MNLKKLFGINVQKYRKLRNLTQEKLSEIVGVDPASISAIETGKYFVSAENLYKISQALNVKISDLFNFENISSNEETYEEILKILSYFKDDSTRLNAIKNFVMALI